MVLEKLHNSNLVEAIVSRHSVRRYISKNIPINILFELNNLISECNIEGDLNIQLVTREKKAFKGIFAYGKFSGVENYLVMAGKKSKDLDERIGYYGELIVLFAQSQGLNTCWTGLSYQKVNNAYNIYNNETIACMISIGYGETQGVQHKCKSVLQVSNLSNDTPFWFKKGVEAALLAPTAINQQKFSFQYAGKTKEGRHKVIAKKGGSLIGYTKMDMGIAKLHFEIGAGKENFIWG